MMPSSQAARFIFLYLVIRLFAAPITFPRLVNAGDDSQYRLFKNGHVIIGGLVGLHKQSEINK
jgi:hypothetical protein